MHGARPNEHLRQYALWEFGEAGIAASWDEKFSFLALVSIQPRKSSSKEQKKNRKPKSIIYILPF